MKILKIEAIQVFDSKGVPAVEVNIAVGNEFKQFVGKSVVPGLHGELFDYYKEFRDKIESEYSGLGVTKAVTSINTFIAKALYNQDFDSIEELDNYLTMLDGTSDRSNLGTNTILGVSMAYASALAKSKELKLYQYLGKVARMKISLPNLLIGLTDSIIVGDIKPVGFSEKLRTLMSIYLEFQKHKGTPDKSWFVKVCEKIGIDFADISIIGVKDIDHGINIDRYKGTEKRAGSVNTIILSYTSGSTVTELITLIKNLKGEGYNVALEPTENSTCDTTISHIAVATGANFVIFDDFTASEYINELLRIEKHIADGETIVI